MKTYQQAMKGMTIFDRRPEQVDNPLVVIPERSEDTDEWEYQEKQIPGTWWRVVPETGADVCFLQMLEPHRDIYAPAAKRGNGVLVSTEVMLRFGHHAFHA